MAKKTKAYTPSGLVEMPKEMYEEMVVRMHRQYKTLEKLKAKVEQEQPGTLRDSRLRLISRTVAICKQNVSWWDNYEKRLIREKEEELQLRRGKEGTEPTAGNPLTGAEPYRQEFNLGCRYYYQCGDERRCSCGMDMCFCGKNCAFATNAVGSTKVYDAPYVGRRRY